MEELVLVFTLVKISQSLAAGWFFSTYVLFLLSHGLTLFQANLLNVGFMITGFFFDPLTGYLADRVGQKRVYLWGQLCWGLGMVLYGLGQTFPIFLLAEVVGAVGGALMSDALESWLRNHIDDSATHKAISRAGALSTLATIPSALLGGVIGEVAGLNWPWLMAALGSIFAAAFGCVLLCRLPEDGKENETKKTLPSLKVIIRQSWRVKPLRFTLLVTLFSSVSFQAFNMFWSPILRDASGSAWWLGAMWIGIAVAMALGSYLANSKHLKLNGAGIAIALLAAGIPMLISPCFPSLPLLVGTFLFHEIGQGALRPLLFTYSNRHIDNRTRATVNSLTSAARTLGAAFGLLVSGWLTTFLSPLSIWGLSAMALILTALYAYKRG